MVETIRQVRASATTFTIATTVLYTLIIVVIIIINHYSAMFVDPTL